MPMPRDGPSWTMNTLPASSTQTAAMVALENVQQLALVLLCSKMGLVDLPIKQLT